MKKPAPEVSPSQTLARPLASRFFMIAAGSNSRISRRIHRAFSSSPHFRLTCEHRKPSWPAF